MTASLYSRAEGFVSGSSRTGPVTRIARVVQYRRILKLLVARDLKVRYAGSTLGYLWTILDPLLMSLVYWFVFAKIFHRHVRGEEPYILFLVSGQLMWAWFNGGVSASARALRAEAQMVRSSNVPRELWVIRVICSKAVEYLLSLPVLAFFALAYLKAPNWHIVLLPVAWLLMFALLIGLGLLLAPLNVLVTDTERVVPIVLRLLFYLSPVIYSVDSIVKSVPRIGLFFKLNPAVGPLSLARAAFFPTELKWDYVVISALMCMAIFAIGLYTFMRLERQVLKEV